MDRGQHAMMWAMIASGVSSSGLQARTAEGVCDRTDEILKEYERRHPEPAREQVPNPSPASRA